MGHSYGYLLSAICYLLVVDAPMSRVSPSLRPSLSPLN